jgi:small subunit ribosomal protein S13
MFISLYGIKISIKKPLFEGLVSIYGINRGQAQAICSILGISLVAPYHILNNKKRKRLRFIMKNMLLGPRLLQLKFQNIKNLKSIRSYRGLRHKFKLPVRGQRSRTNAKTRRKGIA